MLAVPPSSELASIIEYDGRPEPQSFHTSTAMANQPEVAVAADYTEPPTPVDISAGQKMLSAVSGSLLTSLLGRLWQLVESVRES